MENYGQGKAIYKTNQNKAFHPDIQVEYILTFFNYSPVSIEQDYFLLCNIE